MSTSTEIARDLDPSLFERFAALIKDRTGILIAASQDTGTSRHTMLANRLAKPMENARVRSYQQYLRKLETWTDSSQGWIEFVHAVSTHKTEFFRENPHFLVLQNLVKERIRTTNQKAFHFWSSACSTGEEPYSMAIAFDEVIRDQHPGCKLQVFASDIDQLVLDTACKGIYTMPDSSQMSKARLERYFQRGRGQQAGMVRVKQQIRGLVQFDRCNLAQPPYTKRAPFDAIFCRNVLIYFDDSTRRMIARQLASTLAPHGLLFLGHAESMSGEDGFESVAPTVYRYHQTVRRAG